MLTSWRRRTQTGRVVYERKKHLFKVQDMDRMWTAILRSTTGADVLSKLVVDTSLRLLNAVLELFGLDKYAELAYFVVLGHIAALLDRLGVEGARKFAQDIFARLISYYSVDELKGPGTGTPV